MNFSVLNVLQLCKTEVPNLRHCKKTLWSTNVLGIINEHSLGHIYIGESCVENTQECAIFPIPLTKITFLLSFKLDVGTEEVAQWVNICFVGRCTSGWIPSTHVKMQL